MFESNDNKHKSKLLPIKEAWVDEEIVPLVNYINDFVGVYTTSNCQGDTKDDPGLLPHVSFIGTEYRSIIALFHALQDAPCSITIKDDGFHRPIRYHYAIHFDNNEDVQLMVKWVRDKYSSIFDERYNLLG